MTGDVAIHLPGLLGDLARAGFGGDALRLAAEWGGTKRYIPMNPTSDSEICKVISLAAAEVLARSHGNRHHDIPLAAGIGDKKARLRRVEHLPTTAAARAAGCTARYVRMVRNGDGEQDGQADLFGAD